MTYRYKVLISAPYMQPVIERFRPIFEQANVEIVLPEVHERLEEAELLQLMSDIDGVIAGDDRFTAKVIENFTGTERPQVCHDDRGERPTPFKLTVAKGQPKQNAFCRRGKRLRHGEIHPTRFTQEDRRQHQNDYRVGARRQPHTAEQLLPEGKLRREGCQQDRRFDQDRQQISKRQEIPQIRKRQVLGLNEIYFVEKEHKLGTNFHELHK